jgi:hypothetical protein
VAGVGVFIDSKTTSITLVILLFLGVVVVVDNFGNYATTGGLSSFGSSSAIFGSSTASTLALAGMRHSQ